VSQNATIVNKGIQIVLTSMEAVNLAQTGEAVIRVKDQARAIFGEVSVSVSPGVQAAILEHCDLPVPTAMLNAAMQDLDRVRGRVK
jgi:hypothetical protein